MDLLDWEESQYIVKVLHNLLLDVIYFLHKKMWKSFFLMIDPILITIISKSLSPNSNMCVISQSYFGDYFILLIDF